MPSNPQQYMRIPVPVEAWRLTPEDLPQIAKWCGGKVKGLSITFPKIRDRSKPFGSEDHNSYAVIGDVIIRVGKGFVRMEGTKFDREYRSRENRAA